MEYKIIEVKRNNFPQKLLNIKNAPKKLYAIGDIKLLFEDSFAIIGTRKITDYGERICRYFTREFSLRNIPTVSGMAVGTDSVVHDETIKNFGKTIAVLGCGFYNIYPVENLKLYKEIIETGGLVLSEYEPNTKFCKDYFPKRNRIISAISEGVLVIEAAYRSGTSITARNSKQQGKKVFAVPGIIGSSVGEGVNNLIKKGAILSTKIEDILVNYPQFMNKKRINIQREKHIKNEYKEIYDLIKNSKNTIEDITSTLCIPIVNILTVITKMEIEGIIRENNKGVYEIVEERQ